MFGPCRVAGPISEVFLQIHCTMTEHKHNHVTMNFTMKFAWPFLPVCGHIGEIFFEVARTYTNHTGLHYSDEQGALLVCTLLIVALHCYVYTVCFLFLFPA